MRAGGTLSAAVWAQDVLADRKDPTLLNVIGIYRMLGGFDDSKMEIIHLGPDGSNQAQCGFTNALHVGAEYNDITCPFCFCLHEAACAKMDDESEFYEWDIAAILATDSFMQGCMSSLRQRLLTKAKG